MTGLEWLLTVALLLIGLALVVFGADILVGGACAIAKKWGVSEFLIGATIVAIGTSLPELVVSSLGAVEGKSDIAIGNIIGSNIFNTAFILGLSALILPITISRRSLTRDLLLNLGVSVILIVPLLLGTISRWMSLLLFAGFVGYMWISIKHPVDSAPEPMTVSEGEDKEKETTMLKAALQIVFGLVGLVLGGRLFVDKSVLIAQAAGLSEKFIAVTILAAGTSLPELATSTVAAFKGKAQLALGNVIGSNIANVLLILGVSGLICPISMANVTNFDLFTLIFLAAVVILSYFTFNRKKIGRFDSAVLIACGIAYYVILFIFK